MEPLTPEQQTQIERLMPYARTIARSFGHDPEYIGEAFHQLCLAVRSYKPERGPLDQFCGLCIRHRLIRVQERERLHTNVDFSGLKAAEQSSGLYAAMEKLPELSRTVARLRWMEKLSWKELASYLRCSQAQARREVDKARNLLRGLLNE